MHEKGKQNKTNEQWPSTRQRGNPRIYTSNLLARTN